MSAPVGGALYEAWIGRLRAGPRRGLPGSRSDGAWTDALSFERRVAEAETRIRAALGRAARTGPSDADRPLVLLSARNLPSYLTAVAALWKAECVPLLADADLSRSELGGLVSTFRPALAILDRQVDPDGGTAVDLDKALAGLHAWVPGAPHRGDPCGDAGPPRSADGAARTWRLSDAAIVRLTSGTTGRMRGLVVTAAQLLADARHITGSMGIEPDDTMVAAIPLGHAYGFVHVLMALVLQGTRPLLVEQPLPALLVEALASPGPLVMAGTPYLFDLILTSAGARRFPGLRLCVSAGAPLPERLSRAFLDRFGLPIRTFYGASECGGIAYDRSAGGIVPDGCVGTPLDGVAVALEPVPGAEGPCERVCVRSEAVVSGYFEGQADGALRPGLFVTSDLGRIDEAGRLHLLGRIDRLINVSGRKVNPIEIEEALRGLPGLREAVVFGTPDHARGEAVSACLVAGKGLTREAVLAACRARLASYKIPRRIEFVDAIPLTSRGKTDRQALERLVGPPSTRRRS